mmetsp:Transcript_6646/g.20752  ORF Transcript_6646/g.20752 Transcript_6646/m.20752 type:complete len:339 (-) Transcript_6646:130-1146(-)
MMLPKNLLVLAALLAHVASSQDKECPTTTGRLVYVDLGANWANTMRLFSDVGPCQRRSPWEVYAFEAVPVIASYVDNFTSWLNGDGPKPVMRVPPSGSSVDLHRFSKRYACHLEPPVSAKRCLKGCKACLYRHLRNALGALEANATLASADLVQQRLRLALQPPTTTLAKKQKARFTFVPAAAGAATGTMEMVWNRMALIHGGATEKQLADRLEAKERGQNPNIFSDAPSERAEVNVVDVATWLAESFAESDYVFLKMDIEGVEFDLMRKLLDLRKLCLVDLLAWQCHAYHGDCAALEADIRRTCPHIDIRSEGGKAAYPGIDRATIREILDESDFLL